MPVLHAKGRGVALGTVPAGWYPDNQDAAVLRWWDGNQWTFHTKPRQGPLPAAGAPADGTATVGQAGLPASGRHERRPASKRDLHVEVDRLQHTLDGLGVTERDQIATEVGQLRAELGRLRAEHARLSAAVVPLRAEVAALSAQRVQVVPLQAEIQQLLQRRDALAAETAGMAQLADQIPALRAEQAQLSQQVVETRETAILQEAGIYQYRHPLDDAVEYKVKLAVVRARIKDAVKAGTAVKGSTSWTVNGSATQSVKMIREFSKLMLRAYNNEAG
jgi:small-conductance mechanosensitive channel